MDQSRPPVPTVAIELINYEAPVDHVPPHELRLQLNYEAPLHHDEPFEFWLEHGRDPRRVCQFGSNIVQSKVQREITTPVQIKVPTVQNPFTYAATFHPVEHPLLGIDDSLAFNGRVCYYVSAVAGEST